MVDFLRSGLLLWIVWFCVLPAGTPVVAYESTQRPNILLVMVDDMGYSDLGCYGGEIHTPTLDHLAANGVRFARFYNCAQCRPTRAALLSGIYPHQAGMGDMNEARPEPVLEESRLAGLPWFSARGYRHVARSAALGWLSDFHGGQVAPRPQAGLLAARTRLRPLLRHAGRCERAFHLLSLVEK